MLKAIFFMAANWIIGLIYGKDKVEEHKGMQFLWTMLLLFWILSIIGVFTAGNDLVFLIVSIVYLIGLPALIYVIYKKSRKS